MNQEPTDPGTANDQTHSHSQQGALQDPWDPADWDGDIEDLRTRMRGMTIPHDLKCEINLILMQAEPDRFVELLTFIVNTASRLSTEETDRLLQMNLEEEADGEVTALLQKYQISRTILAQWQSWVEQDVQYLTKTGGSGNFRLILPPDPRR
jgi:hypothetical protein